MYIRKSEQHEMRTTLAKWGNSLALRLPKGLAEEANLVPGSTVEIAIDQGRIVVTPTAKKLTLADLLKDLKPSMRRGETDWGPPRGREEW
jgi:antitoxin MazE